MLRGESWYSVYYALDALPLLHKASLCYFSHVDNVNKLILCRLHCSLCCSAFNSESETLELMIEYLFDTSYLEYMELVLQQKITIQLTNADLKS